MPRALFVINGLGTGGAERSLAELLPWLRDAGWDCHVATLLEREKGVEDQVRQEFCVHHLGASHFLARVRSLRRLMKALDLDLIHTTLFEADVTGRLASVGLGVPVVSTLVNTSYEPERLRDPNVRRWRLEAVRMLDGLTARHLVDHFIAITDAVATSAVHRLRIDPERVTVVRRGRDPRRLGEPGVQRRQAARLALGLANGADVIVTVGRQEYQKGQRYLIEAFSDIARLFPQAVVLVAGREGNASQELHLISEDAELGSRLRLLGHVEDIPDLLAAADLFVFPSLYEGLGGALIEAMALGLPIVASDLPAVREVVVADHNALLVPPGDQVALAGAITKLLAEPDLRDDFGIASRARYEATFRLDRSAHRTIELFDDIRLGRHRPSSRRARRPKERISGRRSS